MNIGERPIGPNTPAYVIAEIGVNHDGEPDRALQLVHNAAQTGADAIKLQLFRADLLLSRAAQLANYQRDAGEADPIAMLARLELGDDAMRACVARAHESGMHALVTVFSVELVDRALELGFDAFKTASPDIINRPLLDALACTRRPMIVSTGTATIAEAARAGAWLASVEHVAFLHCVSAYPTPIGDASIEAMRDLAEAVPGRAIGYSDHTTDVMTGAVAVAAGASILEKHLSLDRSAPGPDHAASLEPDTFAEYVRLVRRAGSMLAGGKTPRPIESDVRRVSRQSLVTVRALESGHRISRADLTVKRPGNGIEPWRLDDTIGRTLARPIEGDMPVREDDLLPQGLPKTNRAILSPIRSAPGGTPA